MNPTIAVYCIVILATAGVIVRPFKLPEFIWAVAGALLLVCFRLLSPSHAWTGIAKGADVYLFLTGMMLLAESARQEGLFNWLAGHAVRLARGSAIKLFTLVYLVGCVVTIFMSNDATAVVLTPAVAAAVHSARVKQPLPYLYICAFIANAASFVLPISNPANLVIYGAHMPPLLGWLRTFLIPSLFSIIITFAMLFLTQRKALRHPVATDINLEPLSGGGRIALAGIVATAAILIFASARGWDLGLPVAIAGVFVTLVVVVAAKRNPWKIVGSISWAVLPLVAGLFVMVEALQQTGIISELSRLLEQSAGNEPAATAWISGSVTAVTCNLVNNLPAGLIAGSVAAQLPPLVKSCLLIGIDLGPNLSITGSLATILWLTELRRNGHNVRALEFLKLGVFIMIPALIAALAALWL